MADRSPCLLFKETRVNLDWAGSNATTNINLPRHRSGGFAGIHRASKSLDLSRFDAEDKFRHYYHATAASVHYRPAERYPRCILWRILEGSTVLSITSVDFTKPGPSPELQTKFLLRFPEPLKPSCVGFADAPDRDELIVYALTESGVLYTLNLTPDFLLRNSATRRGARESDYCKTYCPSTFTLHAPHFLLPVNHTSLVVALQDGNILKLTRNPPSEDPEPSLARYTEKTFSDSSYFGFFKNKMPWVGSQTVPYGNGSVYHTTVISAATYVPQGTNGMDVARRGSEDALLLTVSVDHTIKVWSMGRETLLDSKDLLNDPDQAGAKIKTWLDPSPSHLLAILDTPLQEDHIFYVVSFSSATTGQFKFWAAVHDGTGRFSCLVDLYPDFNFEAEPPTTTAPWIISEFKMTRASASDASLYNLWVLWKSDTNFRVQNLQLDITKVGQAMWKCWTTATPDVLHELPKQTPSSVTSEDVADHWMGWIFYPGRFPDPVYETALKIYEDNFATHSDKVSKYESIQARVARVVASAVEPQAGYAGATDYEKYRIEIELQWERFSRLCTEVDKARCEALSLVADPVSGFVWTVNVDGITALRECTESEVIKHNFATHANNLDLLSARTPKKLGAGLQGQDLRDVMLLVAAAEELKSVLSEVALEACVARLKEETTKEPSVSVTDAMWSICRDCLEGEVPEELLEKFADAFQSMEDPQSAFNSITSSLFHSDAPLGSTRLTAFGAKVLVAGSQEVIHTNHELLFNLILLLVLLAQYTDDSAMFKISQPDHLYSQLLLYCKEYEVLRWMAENSLSLPEPSIEDDVSEAMASMTDLRLTGDASPAPDERKGSVLQLMLPENFGPPPPGPGRTGSVALSLCIRQFLAGLELVDYGNGVTNIVSALLRSNARGLATDFAKFVPPTCWGTYMKARVALKTRDDIAAASFFKKASFGMSIENPAQFSGIGPFLSDIELEHAVGGGLPKYYLHVASLYEEAKAPLYVVEFCNAALVVLGESDDMPVRSEVLAKLFQAALHVSMFDEAYLALTQYTDKERQQAALRDLVGVMVEQKEGARLCQYPFVGLQDEVDEALTYKCQTILDVTAGPPFHKVLYSWRIQKGDFRGAASILYERLRKLQNAHVGSADPHSRAVTDGFLALINALSCVDKDQAWILASKRVEEPDTAVGSSSKRTKLSNGTKPSSAQKRQIITLADIKAEYRSEVERLGLLLNGGFFV